MPKIRLLDQAVSEQIAAGEVIERPASVVKELVENSMDAGANSITVDLTGGGVGSIRIIDDGCGIGSEDAPMAFLRHATSKVTTVEDLESVKTMGFRGEALASVAAVAKVCMKTKSKDESVGTQVLIEGGNYLEASEFGCPDGTDLLIEQLFYNTPARLKFLKKDVSEGNAVTSYLEKLAIARPDIRFLHTKDGKVVLKTPGDGDLMACIWAVYGKEFAKTLIPVCATENGISVQGFVSSPSAPRGNRTMQLFYVNGRVIRSKLLQAAVEEAMHGHIMSGKFPACVLKLELNPRLIDVNIHPTKLEVRFANEKDAFRSVYYSVQAGLLAHEQAANGGTKQMIGFSKEKSAPPDQTVMQLLHRPENLPTQKQPVPVTAAPSGLAPKAVQKPQGDAAVYVEKLRQILATDEATTPSVTDHAQADPPKAFDPILQVAAPPVDFGPLTVSADWMGETGKSWLQKRYQQQAEAQSQASSKNNAPTEQAPLQITEQDHPVGLPTEPEDEKQMDQSGSHLSEPDIPVVQTDADAMTVPLDNFVVIGELLRTYILVQTDEGLLVIDKHAAHERILYEQWKTRKPDGQLLLTPLVLRCTAQEFDALWSKQDALAAWQFVLEDFGDRSLLVRQIPAILAPEKAEAALREMAGNLLEHRNGQGSDLEWIYHSVACRAAVKAGDTSTRMELETLTRRVLTDPAIRQCPHGRPVYFVLTRQELEKRFGRIV